MIIKGQDGQSHNVTSQALGNYSAVGASAGIASFLGLNANNLFGRLWGGNGCNCNCSNNGGDTPVSRYEAAMMQELASKDSRIALLEANTYNYQNLTAVYKELASQINSLKEAQSAVNLQQAVYNGTNTAALTCLQNQVAQLYSLTKLVVPNGSVCPGWGNVTITPAAAPTT